MTADILPLELRATLEGLKETLSPLQAAVERYLQSLEVACIAAYGEDACHRVNLRHRMDEVRAGVSRLYRLDERGDAWGAAGDLVEEVEMLAVESQPATVFMCRHEGEAA